MDGYPDKRVSLRDAADHEQRQALALFETGTLVVAVGPAGSGKSRFARGFPSSWVVCLDELRERLTGDSGDQSGTPQAVQLQDLLVEARLERGLTTVLDSTNVEVPVRTSLVERARRHGRPVVAVVFQVPLETCLARNSKRPATVRVPSEVVRWQHEQTVRAVPLLGGEGFTEVRTTGGDAGEGWSV